MRRVASAVLVGLMTLVSVPVAAPQQQNLVRPTVPSPTAASLGKFGDIPVSYFSGVPEISIPLFTARGKTLRLPVSLAYHASGIRLDEIGSWVGMGWTLQAGGVITRTVHGIPDDQAGVGYFFTGHTFYDPANWTSPASVTLVQNIHDMQTIDPEPDQFFFNFAGMSGEMVGGDTSVNHTSTSNIFVAIPYRKWRIVPTWGTEPRTGFGMITSWQITTEDGTKYTFGATEAHIDWQHPWQGTPYDSWPYAAAWYLTKIQSPGGDVITLQYADYNAEHHLGMYREEANDKYEINIGDCGLPGYQQGSSTIYDVHNQSYIYGKTLSSITSATDSIKFSTSLRDDARSPFSGDYLSARVQQEPKLDLMTITTAAGVVVKKFEFEYVYTGPLGGRLTLQNLYEEDPSGNRLPPYSFTYSGPTLPARVTDRTDYHAPTLTASFAYDFWGYYNGATGNNTLGTPIPTGTDQATGHYFPEADRNPNIAYTVAGVLTRVTYPTGGFNDFIYEANDYSNGGSLVSDPQGKSASASATGGADASHDFTVGGIDPTDNATLTIYIPAVCSTSPCPSVQILQGATVLGEWTRGSNDPAQRNFPVPPTGQVSRNTTYTLKVFSQGQNLTGISINAYWSERYALTSKPAGGLRIKEVHADDGMGHVIIHKYGYKSADGRSSGWLAEEPRFDYHRNLVSADQTKQCIYYSRSSTPRNVLGGGPVIEYSVVTESLGVSGQFGITQHTLVAGCDCANAAQAGNYNQDWPMLRYTRAGWTRGQETNVNEYNASGAPQQASAVTWAIPPMPYPTISLRGLAVDVYSMWSRGGQTNTYFIWTNRFQVQTALKVQTDQTTTFYDTTGTTSFSTNRHFVYGNPNHAQVTEIDETNSDGTQRITRMKYPGDYATGGAAGTEAGALAAMQDVSTTGAAMPGVVIERTVSSRVGANERLVQADITTFKEFLSGQFLPYKHYVFNSPSPLP